MTFAATRWPPPVTGLQPRGTVAGACSVWRLELAKLIRLNRVRVVLAACVVAPFAVVAGIGVQSAVPADTLFGQWVHESGFALALVVLGFAGQWALPAVVAVVAGDVFSAEDHFGTWKTVLTRSRSRGQVFTGKALAVLVYIVVALVLLTAAGLAAAVTVGANPVTGLGGQLVPAGHAAALVAASWALELPPMLAFAALALLASVTSRSSVVGIGLPVLAGLGCQVLSLVDLPAAMRIALPSTPFESWHGLWTAPAFHDPIWHGLLTSAGWTVGCLALTWAVFARRDIRVAT